MLIAGGGLRDNCWDLFTLGDDGKHSRRQKEYRISNVIGYVLCPEDHARQGESLSTKSFLSNSKGK